MCEYLYGSENKVKEMLDKNSYKPLYIQVKDYLLEQIRSGKLKVGEQLPTERELMNTMHVGRATVRSALSELEHDGRVVKRHGIGTFVSDNKKRVFTFEPLISLSYSLECMGIESVNEIVTNEEITVGDGVLSERWERGQKVQHIKRLRIANGQTVAVEDSYFIPEVYHNLASSDLTQSLAHALITQGDVAVNRIDQSIIIREGSESERKDLILTSEQKVIELLRWTYDEKTDKPITFVRFVVQEEMMAYPFSAMKHVK